MATDTATSQPKLCATVTDTLNQQSRLSSSLTRLDAIAQRLGATPPPPTAGNAAQGSSGDAPAPTPTLAFLVNTSNAKAADAVNRIEDIVLRLEAQV